MVEDAKAFLKVRLADLAESWLLSLRQEYRAIARPLHDWERSALRGYLKPDLLAAARVAEVDRIPEPPFLSSLANWGLPTPCSFSREPGLAVVDTVALARSVVPEGRWLSVLFHECVHLQQFQALGVSRMVARYIKGLFDNGFDYGDLPMERQAQELRLRFDSGYRVFSVEKEVEAALLNGSI